MPSRPAICALVSPAPASASTSRSRGLSWKRPTHAPLLTGRAPGCLFLLALLVSQALACYVARKDRQNQCGNVELLKAQTYRAEIGQRRQHEGDSDGRRELLRAAQLDEGLRPVQELENYRATQAATDDGQQEVEQNACFRGHGVPFLLCRLLRRFGLCAGARSGAPGPQPRPDRRAAVGFLRRRLVPVVDVQLVFVLAHP